MRYSPASELTFSLKDVIGIVLFLLAMIGGYGTFASWKTTVDLSLKELKQTTDTLLERSEKHRDELDTLSTKRHTR